MPISINLEEEFCIINLVFISLMDKGKVDDRVPISIYNGILILFLF